MTSPKISEAVIDEISREADVDKRSVLRALAGLAVRGRAGQRVQRQLEARGLVKALEPAVDEKAS